MIRWVTYAGLFTLSVLGGCSGYLAGELEPFRAEMIAAHPIGSPASQLIETVRTNGFRGKERSPFREEICYSRNLSYGLWAGGKRYVCYEASENGSLTATRVFDLVAGL
jgi:hypothetical protein